MGKRHVVCYMPKWSQCQMVSEPAQERARAQGGLLYLLWPRTKDQEQASPHYPQTGLSDCSGHTTCVTHTHSLTCAFNPNHLSHKTMTNSLHDALIERANTSLPTENLPVSGKASERLLAFAAS